MVFKISFTVHQEILLGQTFLKMQQVRLVSIYIVNDLVRERGDGLSFIFLDHDNVFVFMVAYHEGVK